MALDLIVRPAVRIIHRVMYVERPWRMTIGNCPMGVLFVNIVIRRLFMLRALLSLYLKK